MLVLTLQRSGQLLRGAAKLSLRFSSSSSTSGSTSTFNPHGLHGSVSPHVRQLVLFTGRKYETIPSHINTVSPLYRAICDLFKDEKSSLKDYAIAVTDSSHPLTRAQPERQWSAETNRFDVQTDDTDGKKEQEEYGAVIYPDNIEVPFSLSLESMAELEQFCAALPVKALDTPDDRPNGHARDHIDVFVCTHGARDCRCGDVGTSFYDNLGREARRRKRGHFANSYRAGDGPIRIHRTTHIGGHRFAATCFTSTGDWYGLLATGDAADFVRKLSKQIDNESYEKEIWWEKWRGRTGLSQEAQIATAAEALSQTRALSSDDLAESLKGKPKAIRKPLGEKFDILFTNSDGERITVGAYEGETLMDCAKRADLVEATCGGFCECATCMMHLVPNGKGEAAPVPEVSEEEDDQLEYALFADDDSRLACQIEITPQLKDWLAEGGKIRLPRA